MIILIHTVTGSTLKPSSIIFLWLIHPSTLSQKWHLSSTVSLMVDMNEFTGKIQWRTLQWRSACLFESGGLYSALHWGLQSGARPKIQPVPVHGLHQHLIRHLPRYIPYGNRCCSFQTTLCRIQCSLSPIKSTKTKQASAERHGSRGGSSWTQAKNERQTDL